MSLFFFRKAFTAKRLQTALWPLLLLALGMSLSACDMKLPPMPWDKPAEKTAHSGKEAEHAAGQEEGGEEEGGDEEATEEESGPTGELALLPKAMHTLPFEEITITLPDQLLLYGRLYDPTLTSQGENEIEDAESYTGKKYPLVILLHGLNRSHTAWSDLPATLVKAGYAVYAVDLRGHGKSTITARNNRATWRLMDAKQWTTLHRDIGYAINYFKKGEDYPEIDGTHIAVFGEKLGANVATFVSKNSDEVKAQVLISPGLEFKGIDASRGLLGYANPTLILTSKDVKESYIVANHLYNWITGPKTLQIYEKIGEGADMVNRQSSVQQHILNWLITALPPVTDAPADASTSDAGGEGAPTQQEVAPPPSTEAAH